MTADQAITLLGVLLSAGLGSFIWSQMKVWAVRRRERQNDTADRRHLAEVDDSLLTVVRARDELEDDNRRLREQLVEERRMRAEDQQRHDRELAQAERQKQELRAEIDRLETKLRELLAEVQDLKERSA